MCVNTTDQECQVLLELPWDPVVLCHMGDRYAQEILDLLAGPWILGSLVYLNRRETRVVRHSLSHHLLQVNQMCHYPALCITSQSR